MKEKHGKWSVWQIRIRPLLPLSKFNLGGRTIFISYVLNSRAWHCTWSRHFLRQKSLNLNLHQLSSSRNLGSESWFLVLLLAHHRSKYSPWLAKYILYIPDKSFDVLKGHETVAIVWEPILSPMHWGVVVSVNMVATSSQGHSPHLPPAVSVFLSLSPQLPWLLLPFQQSHKGPSYSFSSVHFIPCSQKDVSCLGGFPSP